MEDPSVKSMSEITRIHVSLLILDSKFFPNSFRMFRYIVRYDVTIKYKDFWQIGFYYISLLFVGNLKEKILIELKKKVFDNFLTI